MGSIFDSWDEAGPRERAELAAPGMRSRRQRACTQAPCPPNGRPRRRSAYILLQTRRKAVAGRIRAAAAPSLAVVHASSRRIWDHAFAGTAPVGWK
ncbi:hypothetical protein Acsp04_50420 [Actinomadura sp. NBRC 104425]|nr:hypothetical protein Acsp04_50420 [Actinomadura sp. NBRC 104425]